MFSFNSQMTNKDSKKEYAIQITTDNYEQFKFIQDCARECVDGKHTEGVLSTYQKLVEDYIEEGNLDYCPDCLSKIKKQTGVGI